MSRNKVTYLLHQTPKSLAEELFSLIEYDDGDSFYEPFRGEGAFYDLMPTPKYWTEIELGRDFYDYNFNVDHIITNPPFKIDGKNCVISTLERCFDLANISVNFLMNHKMFNSLTPKRLQKYSDLGWNIVDVCVCNVKKWYGRYYFLQFRKDVEPIINWLNGVY